jgi:hypothetical protein
MASGLIVFNALGEEILNSNQIGIHLVDSFTIASPPAGTTTSGSLTYGTNITYSRFGGVWAKAGYNSTVIVDYLTITVSGNVLSWTYAAPAAYPNVWGWVAEQDITNVYINVYESN